MDKVIKKTLFTIFFLSGFCSLLYQVVWIRLAFAHFGIITPVLSVVISVFMLGLAIGSWGGGRIIKGLSKKTSLSPNIFYAFAEFFIGLGAFAVPLFFNLSEQLLLHLGQSNSFAYLLFSALLIAASILAPCILMGTTFPFVMEYMQRAQPGHGKSFSFLYFANSIGAIVGTILTTLVFIEAYGFTHTLWLAGCFNFLIAGLALMLPKLATGPNNAGDAVDNGPSSVISSGQYGAAAIIFFTGFSSMAMEVVWTRNFTPVLGTQVYAFALLLAGYLLGTAIGSFLYRVVVAYGMRIFSKEKLLAMLSIASLLPIIINDPQRSFFRGTIGNIALIIISIVPLTAILGYLTPSIIDDYSRGNPRKAGKWYSLNILGCIIGPLFASYLLLPFIGAKSSLIILFLPFFLLLLINLRSLEVEWKFCAVPSSLLLFLFSWLWCSSYEIPNVNIAKLTRDYTATVIAVQSTNARSGYLLVNGVGMTSFTPITKIMAHLPLLMHQGQPKCGLIICFGMGTTFRSMLSWGIDTTVVELVPGVRDVFPCFFSDARQVIGNPNGKIIIDDGRRFLMRAKKKFDVVTIDPPPPVEAAGSSLLYSSEFYQAVKRRLNPQGIVQQWFPAAICNDAYTLTAVTQSLCDSFRYVKAYSSIGAYGVHFIASDSPLNTRTTRDMLALMPQAAQRDLMEWFINKDTQTILSMMVSKEIPPAALLPRDRSFSITDDHPYNEYYLLRYAVKHIRIN